MWQSLSDRLFLIFNLCEEASHMPFDLYVRSTCAYQCTDPRDKIYALLSLRMPEEREIVIRPDYSMSISDVYQDLVVRYVEAGQTSRILTLCDLDKKRIDAPSWVPDFSRDFPQKFINVSAASHSVSDTRYLGSGVLRATGVYSATVSRAQQLGDIQADSMFLNAIRHAALPGLLEDDYVAGQSMLTAFCLTICAGNPSYWSDTPEKIESQLEEAKGFIRALLEASTKEEPGIEGTITEALALYLNNAKLVMVGRSYFLTEQGYIGLGPPCAREGDIVAVLLGCTVPLMLRPTQYGTYQVVGESFVQGLTTGEALVGSLPYHYQPTTNKYHPKHGGWYRVFYNKETKKTEWEDPRLKKFPIYKVRSNKLRSHIHVTRGGGFRLKREVFEKLGAQLRDFDLV